MNLLVRSHFIILFFFTFTSQAFSQTQKAVVAGDFADPSVIRKGNQYYAVGTSSEWAPHFPIFTSSNLLDWKQTGYVFDKAPEWTSGSFWAPEYYFHKGTYFLYYTARRKKDGVSYIGVATSKFPDKGFKDHGVIIEHGKEAIDAFVYDDNGQLYITFKAYGLDKRPIEILGSKLSADGLKLEGETFSLLKDVKGVGIEGQSILKRGDYYYLFYSAGNCCGIKCDYDVRVARAKSLTAPFEEFQNNPILAETKDWKCPGHGTFVNTPAGKTFYLYHSYSKQSNVFTGREGMLAELSWNAETGWPALKPETTAEAAIKKSANSVVDNFDGKMVSNAWQWDFRNSTPVVKQINGSLNLSGVIKEGNNSGIALTRRPVSTNFTAITTVTNQNSALKGLVFYGDANAALGLGVTANKIEYWVVKNNKREVIGSETLSAINKPVGLKIVAQSDLTCKVFYSEENGKWKELKGEGDYSYKFLPQWDRSPRVGLNFNGDANQNAVFSSFTLTND
ncbi:MAG: beta-xylosidase [Pedobacter sp.]|nr:MAG: beta-xylosidase [Pedobacter sp.]